MGGLKATGATECELVVLHVNGAYEMGGGRFGEERANAWLLSFTTREVEENWRMILRARDRMRKEARS
jgi:hypothetical protein